MGVKVREKIKDSGIWWVFINHNGNRASRQIGTLKAANKVKEQIEAKLKLGLEALPKEAPRVPTIQQYYHETFTSVYLESAVARSTAASYRHNFKTHILPAMGRCQLDKSDHNKMEEFVSDLVKKKLAKA